MIVPLHEYFGLVSHSQSKNGEMIFEHLFGDNFCDNFLFHTHIIFTLSLYCFDFHANSYFFFVNYGYHVNKIDCSNNTLKKYRVN